MILFELLTGELPFRGSLRMLLEQILKDEPPSPRKLRQPDPPRPGNDLPEVPGEGAWRRYGTAQDVG